IADNARDLDFAMRWGFGWAQGPFETWQAAGWREIARAIEADIDAGRAMATASLPDWVSARVGVHEGGGFLFGSVRDTQVALDATGLRPAALPRNACRRGGQRPRHDALGERRRATVAAGPGSPHRPPVVLEEEGNDCQRRGRRRPRGRRARGAGFRWPGDLARSAVRARRKLKRGAGGLQGQSIWVAGTLRGQVSARGDET